MDSFPRRTFWASRIEPRLAHRADPQGHRRGSGANPGSASAVVDREPGQSSGADPAQSVAWSAIERALHAQDSTFLLYGVTGSGKPSSICAPRPGAFATANQHSCSCRRSPCHPRSPTGSPPASAIGWRSSTPAFPTRSATPPGRESPPGATRWWSASLRAVRPGAGRGIDRPRRRARPGLQAGFRASLPRAIGCRALGAVDGRGADPGQRDTLRRDLLAIPAGRRQPRVAGARRTGAAGNRRVARKHCLELPRVDVVDMRLELHRGNTSC